MLPTTLPDWLSYLERLHPKSIELGLERVDRVRQRMGLVPDFPIITVGGTNGKGSTCAMLESVLGEAGYRVGCYTSPHLLRYNERVRVNCQEASDADLCEAFEQVGAARGDIALTYFEFGTLAALWHFARSNLDAAVLEIGLGGRLDAVNTFEPDCAVITSIDLDHLDYLGTTRESIGFEKAGIYRNGKPALCGDPAPPETVPNSARNIGARYLQIGVDFGYKPHDVRWDFWNRERRIENLPLPALSGSFQLGNAACAIEALMVMQTKLPVTTQQLRTGLSNVRLSGRFQTLHSQPQLIVDVAHNPHAARGLAENLRQNRDGWTLAVFAMLADKDIAGVLHMMAPEIDAWYVAGIDNVRGTTADQVAQLVREQVPGAVVTACDSVTAALTLACRSAGENDRIVAFGSFYTVADVLRALPTLEQAYGC